MLLHPSLLHTFTFVTVPIQMLMMSCSWDFDDYFFCSVQESGMFVTFIHPACWLSTLKKFVSVFLYSSFRQLCNARNREKTETKRRRGQKKTKKKMKMRKKRGPRSHSPPKRFLQEIHVPPPLHRPHRPSDIIAQPAGPAHAHAHGADLLPRLALQ